jgi:protein-S-isoprenylcysteine O-methyltransferase Ste14
MPAEVILRIILLNFVAALWVVFEIWLIVRDRIRGKGKMEHDRGTIYLNFASIAVGLTAAGFISGHTEFRLPGGSNAAFWIGLAIMATGFFVRVWAVTALGASFRTTVETHVNQKVKKDGPYRLVRHPSYSGLLLMCTGYGIASLNWLSLIVAIVLPLCALLYRVRVEEEVLVKSLGTEYEEYQGQTKRLIPWIF